MPRTIAIGDIHGCAIALTKLIEVVAPQFHHWIVPIAVVIMLWLFGSQRFGTDKVGWRHDLRFADLPPGRHRLDVLVGFYFRLVYFVVGAAHLPEDGYMGLRADYLFLYVALEAVHHG